MQVNPLVQQREFVAGKALVELQNRSVIEISGGDRLKWLHNMLSANILNLVSGDSCEALLLDANGHIEADLHLLLGEDIVFAIVDTSVLAHLLGWFQKTKFRSDVAWADVSGKYSVVGSWGLAVTKLAWHDPWPNLVAGGYRYAKSFGEAWNWFENLVCADRLAELKNEYTFYSEAITDALRVAALRPAVAELDVKSLPHELDLLTTAVHLSKGCYRGQETVAKVHNLGHPPRRLVLLHLDGSEHELPAVGSEVIYNEQAKGRVTTVGHHYELGPIALAVVSRSVPENATLLVGGIAASQEVIVPASAGAVVDRSRPLRKSLL